MAAGPHPARSGPCAVPYAAGRIQKQDFGQLNITGNNKKLPLKAGEYLCGDANYREIITILQKLFPKATKIYKSSGAQVRADP